MKFHSGTLSNLGVNNTCKINVKWQIMDFWVSKWPLFFSSPFNSIGHGISKKVYMLGSLTTRTPCTPFRALKCTPKWVRGVLVVTDPNIYTFLEIPWPMELNGEEKKFSHFLTKKSKICHFTLIQKWGFHTNVHHVHRYTIIVYIKLIYN